MSVILPLLLIAAGLVALFFGGEWLVSGSVAFALRLRVPTLIIGLTVVAVGTSSPELLVSMQSAIDGVSGIALGNVIGSNIANIGLILGSIGLFMRIDVSRKLLFREIPALIVVTLFASALILDGNLSRLDGAALLLCFIGYNTWLVLIARREHNSAVDAPASPADEVDTDSALTTTGATLRIVAGIALLFVGARLLVDGTVDLARMAGVSELVIGLTMVAFGTSLPELAASISAARKKEADIIMGNLVGSNIANLLLVLGATALILPFDVTSSLGVAEFVVMVGMTLSLLWFAANQNISRLESAILFAIYVAFVFYSFVLNGQL